MQSAKSRRNALISVYRKTRSVIRLAKKIENLGFRIYASEGTAKFLSKNKVKVVDISKLTGFPPILNHHVVTLHPKIHAGILAKETKKHEEELKRIRIPKIDLIIVDIYPVWEGIKSGSLEKVLNLIDIGGPTMLRAAAKNFNNNRTVICEMKDANLVINQIKKTGEVEYKTRRKLAAKVFDLMEKYDGSIARFLENNEPEGLTLKVSFNAGQKLRYGENPHQRGWFYKDESVRDPLAIQKFKQLQGKDLSFNNYLDIDAAVFTLSQVGGQKPACVVIKHTNPVGFSVKDTIEKAYHSAWYEGDPLAAFGGVVGVNRSVNKPLAKKMLVGKAGEKKFFEVLLAPSVDKKALEVLLNRKDLRVLINPVLRSPKVSYEKDFKKIRGGILYQEADTREVTEKDLKVVTKKKPTKKQIEDLLFSWKAVKASKSNAVCIVKNQTLIASGVGQQDRKESCKIAIAKSIDPSRGKSKSTPVGSVAASDAFFPFPDGPEILIKAGVKAITQPGGSIRDQGTIDLCNQKGIPMVFTDTRSFRH